MEIIWRFMKTFILFRSDLIHIFIELLHFLLIVMISGSIIVRMAPTLTATQTALFTRQGRAEICREGIHQIEAESIVKLKKLLELTWKIPYV